MTMWDEPCEQDGL